jgi:L-2-hydroxyglutarate oxidase LhgO
MLYGYCAERGVAAKAVGKLVVATEDAQRHVIQNLARTAAANGVPDIAVLDPAEAARLEPEVRCVQALHSPSSGIVDSHALMLSLQGDLEAAGGLVALGAPVEGGEAGNDGVRLEVGGADPISVRARLVVNAAGLAAPAIARSLRGFPPARVPPSYMAKGVYFGLSGVRAPFRRLVYPVPEQAGLGIHATVDLGGQVRFGPDVEWVERPDYEVDPTRAEKFYAAIRTYWPGLPDGSLRPDYAGIRPKIAGPGEPAADFWIEGPAGHGCPGLVNLFGIESPGLTASLAIADHVLALARAEPAMVI